MRSTVLFQPVATSTAALLTISGLRLILPQKEILALEASTEVDTRDAEPRSAGWLHHAQQRWPVYCISPELSLLDAVPTARRACVLLGAEFGCVGILCDDVSIEQSLNQRHELPHAMVSLDTPVLGLIALDENNIACVTSAKSMVEHVARLVGA